MPVYVSIPAFKTDFAATRRQQFGIGASQIVRVQFWPRLHHTYTSVCARTTAIVLIPFTAQANPFAIISAV